MKKILLTSIFLLLGGCASMVAPEKKTIEITSDPIGIHCHIEREDGKKMSKEKETPFFVTVHDDEYDQKVVCDNNLTSDLKDSVHGATFFNMWTLLFPLLMGVDYSTGSMFEYEDTHVTELN